MGPRALWVGPHQIVPRQKASTLKICSVTDCNRDVSILIVNSGVVSSPIPKVNLTLYCRSL